MYQIKRVIKYYQFSPKAFVEWAKHVNLGTDSIHSEACEYGRFLEEKPAHSDDEEKDAAYRDNYVVLLTGMPADSSNTRLMRHTSSIFFNVTDADAENTFVVEDFFGGGGKVTASWPTAKCSASVSAVACNAASAASRTKT